MIRYLLFLLLALPALAQVEVRRYATMTELLSANPNAFAVAGRATVIVTGRTNLNDGWSRVLGYSSADTNAADNATIFSPSNTNFPGRYRLLYLENPTNSSVRAGVLPPYGYNALWINGAWVSVSNLFRAGTNMQVTVASNSVTFAMTNLVGSGSSGTPLIATVDGLTFTNLDLVSFGDLYWNVPDGTNLYAQLYPNAVDYDEIQTVSGQRLLGNPSGSSANVSEISIGANLALSGGGVLSATVPAGTNSFQIGVDGTLVTTPNLADSIEINPTASGTNVTFSLFSTSVALSKLESIGAGKLVGRGSSGSGSPEQITLGTGLSMSGTTVNPSVTGFSVNGTAVTAPNMLNAAEISASISALTNVYMSLNAGSVGLSKIADVSSGTLLGRGATGTGSVSQITLGTGLALTTNGVLSATGTNTTLVRVGGTSVTGPNFLDSTEMDWYIDLSTNISVDLFPASVVFSKLQSISTSRLLGRSTSGSGAIEQLQIGSGLSLVSGTLSATGGGGGSSVYVDGVSVSSPNFTDAATTGLFDVSGTNVTIRLPDRDFGSVTVSSSGTAINLDTGSISSNHIASGQISQDKLGTSGTGTSTNFLAGDYTYKQVTTNMIPGLNAILATIGPSGGSTTDNVLQRTGYGIFRSTVNNIADSATNGVVEAITHNSGSGSVAMIVAVALTTRSDTNYLVGVEIEDSNTLSSSEPAIWDVAEKTTTGFKIHSKLNGTGAQPNGYWYRFWILEPVTVGGSGGGGGSGTVTSVGASTTVSGLGFSGSPVTASGTLSLTGTVAVASGGTGAANAADARSNLGVLSSRWLTGFGSPTNYSQGTGSYYVNLDTYQVWEQTDTNTWATIPYFVMGEGVYSYLDQVNMFSTTNYFLGPIVAQAGISGNGASLTNLNGSEITSGTVADARIASTIARQSGNNTFTGTNTFSGTTTFNDLSIGSITVVTNLSVPDNAYGAGWNGSTNVPNENSVYDEVELRAPKASPTFSGTLTNTGSIGAPVQYVGSTNIAEALAAKQPLDSDLTSMAAGTAVATAQTNAVSMGAPTLYVGSTNVAAAIAAKAPIAGPSFTGTATNTGSFGAPTLYVGSTNVAAAIALKANIAGPSFTGTATNTGSFGAPTLYVGSTNVAVALASFSSSDTNWNGTPVSSGTITNLTTEKINSLPYYNTANGDTWVEGLGTSASSAFSPYLGISLGSGTLLNDASSTNNFGTWSMRSSTSASSGYQLIVSPNSLALNGGGHEHTTVCLIHETNLVTGYFGFQDAWFDTVLPTDGVFILLQNGFWSGVLISGGSATYTTTSNQVVTSDTDMMRLVSTADVGAATASFLVQKATGAATYSNVWSATITNTLPSGVTGFGATVFRSTGSNSLPLVSIDALGQRNLRLFKR